MHTETFFWLQWDENTLFLGSPYGLRVSNEVDFFSWGDSGTTFSPDFSGWQCGYGYDPWQHMLPYGGLKSKKGGVYRELCSFWWFWWKWGTLYLCQCPIYHIPLDSSHQELSNGIWVCIYWTYWWKYMSFCVQEFHRSSQWQGRLKLGVSRNE